MRSSNRFVWLVVALALNVPCLRAELRAAVARADITPPPGAAMWGYSSRQGTATGTRDPLLARVLLLEADALEATGSQAGPGRTGAQRARTTLALVTLDLGRTFGAARLNAVRARVRDAGITHVVFAASHTHSGPVILDEYEGDAPEWERRAVDSIARTIVEAASRLQPAHLGSGLGLAFIGHDRRYVRLDGSVKMLWRNATGLPTYPADPTVAVLRVDDSRGQPLAILVNYACHPVVFGPDHLRFSADYPGEMARAVEQGWGGRTMVFFLQGAPGDINPFMDKTPLRENADQEVARVGGVLAREALRVSREISTRVLPDAALGVAVENLSFPPRYDAEKTRALLTRTAGAPAAARLAALTRPAYELPSTAIYLRGGGQEWAFAGMPGEPFVGFQLGLRQRSPVAHSYFLGYANGYFGYLPTLREAVAGGYGANGITAWIEVGAGERLLDRAIINLYRLSGRLSDRPEQPP